MAEPPADLRRSLLGASLVAAGLITLIRLAGPARIVSILLLAAGAFYLNRTDPKRLTAIVVVVAVGFGWLAYRAWER